jgi:hypothetical protein
MTQEEKILLLKDLCGRLAYNVVINCTDDDTDYKCFLTTDILNELLHNIEYYNYKPYLRPLSSMTEKESKEYHKMIVKSQDCSFANNESATTMVNDWLLSKGFDVRGLIHKGLALKAPEGMYR